MTSPGGVGRARERPEVDAAEPEPRGDLAAGGERGERRIVGRLAADHRAELELPGVGEPRQPCRPGLHGPRVPGVGVGVQGPDRQLVARGHAERARDPRAVPGLGIRRTRRGDQQRAGARGVVAPVVRDAEQQRGVEIRRRGGVRGAQGRDRRRELTGLEPRQAALELRAAVVDVADVVVGGRRWPERGPRHAHRDRDPARR